MSPRLLAVSLFVLACAGCSGHQVVDGNYRFAEGTDQGLIIVSTRLSHDCKGGENPTATFVYIDESFTQSKMGELPFNSPYLEKDFQDPPGHFFVKELPAEPHLLRYLRIYLGKDMTREYRIPFKVQPGKAVYLGELYVELTNCGSFPSLSLRVNDAWARDRQFFEKQMKNVRSEDVIKQLIPPPRS